MFKSKIIIPIVIFVTLSIITSMIKNQTRIIEKEVYKLNKKITLKEKDINESQLDFYFLTSPAEIERKINALGKVIYTPIKHSNIFLNISSFTNIQKKISILKKKNEKKTQKN